MEKFNLPTKTKIAAWWNIMVGLIMIIFSGWIYAEEKIRFLICSFWGLFFLIFACYLLIKKKGWAWWILVVMNCILTIYIGYHFFPFLPLAFTHILFASGVALIGVVLFVIFLVPLILLFLDRKNFWKIAT